MTPETAVLRQITDYLDVKRIWWMRIQPVNAQTTSGRWMRCAQVGCADLLCSLNGRILWIEVKSPRGQQTDAQKQFQVIVESYGHSYIVARSIDDLSKLI